MVAGGGFSERFLDLFFGFRENWEWSLRNVIMNIVMPVVALALFIFVAIMVKNGGEALEPWSIRLPGARDYHDGWEENPLSFLAFGFKDLLEIQRFIDNNGVVHQFDTRPESMREDVYLLVKSRDFLQTICYGLMGLGDTLLVLLFGWLNGVLKKREGNADEEETSPVAIFLEGMKEGPGETIALYLFGNVVAWASAFLGFKITLLLAPHIPEQVNGKIVLLFIIMLVLGLPVVRSFIRYLFYNIALSLAGSSFLGWILFPVSILLLEFVILKAIDNAQDTGVQLFLIHVKKAFKPDDSLIHRILFFVIMLVAVLTPAILCTMVFGNYLHNK